MNPMNPMNPIRIMTWLAAAHAFAASLVARPAEIIPVTMQLDWKPNVQFAGLVVALEKGYYRDAGLDVRLRPVDSGMKVVEAVEAGTNWLGCSESGVLLGARARGARIKAVGTMLQGSPFCLMSPKAKGIRKPADLAGRTLGVHPDADLALTTPAAVREAIERLVGAAHDNTGSTITLHGLAELPQLPQPAAACVYRTVQEGLTNALKYAAGAPLSIACTVDAGTLELQLLNGPGRCISECGGGGFGILGLQERAQALGGTITAGSDSGGGWRLTLRLPLDGSSDR
jgi:hypothetical protein